MDAILISLVKIHFTFIIIAGGQLILFNQVLTATEQINEKLRTGGTRYKKQANRLLIAEYLLFFLVFVLTLILIVCRVYNYEMWGEFYSSNTTFIQNYLWILLLVMLIQALARLNLSSIRKVQAKNERMNGST